ncbi:MAG: C-terminal processing peptidase-3 [Bacteroidota bacterium]|nr:C-terminal processing peptidase-3 [Bacteroidota bacterium]
MLIFLNIIIQCRLNSTFALQIYDFHMDIDPITPPKKYNVFLPIILSFVLVLGIWLGYFLNKRISTGSGIRENYHSSTNEKINSLLDYIEYQYVDTINKKNLVEKTVTAMLQSLDPHSSYIAASEFEAVNEPLEGNFDGIGVEFNIIKDTIRVIAPIAGGPSEKIGIRAGDRLVKVEGKNMAGVNITNKEVFEKLRGKSGTIVKVAVLRSGVSKLLEFNITRGAIPLYSLDAAYMLDPTIGYIKISKFAATTYQEYLKAFNDLSKKGMTKLVLDLRGNPGGYLNAAVDISDEFLANGLQIVYTQGKANPKKTYKATQHGSFENNPLVILIDEGSASASEIVAGAVQDNDRGTIIGRRSFGKGLVQDQLQLPDGSAIRLTIARYYTPTGRCIQKPYSEDKDEYYNEEYDRYQHGELLNQDSIKLDKTKQYKTPEGKTVYGGGGIMPDVFVPIDTTKTNTFLNKVFYTGVINTFAFEYADNNRTQLKTYGSALKFINDFEVSAAILEEFYAYCAGQKLTLDNTALKGKTNEALKPYLKAFIGRDVFDKDAYYPIINKKDKCILKAVEVLSK